MKQLICEMCDSTDFMKQDGMFVCQSCGCKYSVEEARKLMSSANNPSPGVDNTKLQNLLNLAHSSYESNNYAQAEEFCNQVIAMDGTNYDAWKLKGEAINYQINSENKRILEVYNCLMTAYKVLNEEDQDEKRGEILSSLKTCMEGEVKFWLKQFEAGRPTKAALTRAKNAYIDAYNKMKAAFEELGLEESKEGYLTNFDNFFVGKCNAICNDAWKSTVGYNYYRDYMGQGKDPFGRTDQRWVIANTDLYRPSKHIWDTFLEEADNLISLLQFAEEQFNDDTNPKVMEAIYSNIAFFEECIISSGSWKITQGYTSNWDQYKTVGWHEEYSLTDAAKNSRRAIMNKYKEKERTVPKEVEARQKAKKEKERKESIAKYWEAHAEEKAKMDHDLEMFQQKKDELNNKIAQMDKEIESKRKERDRTLPIEEEFKKQRRLIADLEQEKAACGLFKSKEKKAIQSRIDTIEKPKLEALRKQADAESDTHFNKVNEEINGLINERDTLRKGLDPLDAGMETITLLINTKPFLNN